MQDIAGLEESDTIAALEELSSPKRFIRGHHSHQIDVPLVITTVDDQQSFSISALLDSGCIGSSINQQFVKKHQISTCQVA